MHCSWCKLTTRWLTPATTQYTRYLLSDACVLSRRPLVSGAALGTDGHLTVYCLGNDGAPEGAVLNASPHLPDRRR